jgi:glutamyl-tRNA synthetase
VDSPVANPVESPVVGRLAPSPTGLLHVGHARSFLAAWWSARSAGGRVVLRIEDLDSTRCRPEWTDAARADLEWLGIDWDEELIQSDDLAPYHAAVDTLLERGLAYPCVCSRKAILAALSAPHARGDELRYPGTCRDRFVDDALVGRFAAAPASECGDFLLLRRDGQVAYQLAVVVDDARQGVSEVVRGDDLLPSAVRQRLLQDALDLRHPRQVHLPLVVDEHGRRLSKRDRDLTLAELREAGCDPRRLVQWAARSLGMVAEGDGLEPAAGWTPRFALDRVPRDTCVLDPDTVGELIARRDPR